MADAMTKPVDDKPTIRVHEDSKLKYIQGGTKVLFEMGVLLPRDLFNRIRNVPGEVVKECFRVVNDPDYRCYDWAYACSTGQLRRKKGKTEKHAPPKPTPIEPEPTSAPTQEPVQVTIEQKLPEPVETGPVQVTTEQKLSEPVIEQQAEEPIASMPLPLPLPEIKKPVEKEFSSAPLIMFVMGIVGIGCGIMSAYHSSTFLAYGGKPVWTAVMTGIMLILFSGTAFTAARYFFRFGGALNLFGGLFIIAGFAVIVYSMFATLTVNYEQFQRRDAEKTVVAIDNSAEVALHTRLLQENQTRIDDVNTQIDRLTKEGEYWQTMSWRRYDVIQGELREFTQKREMLRLERIELEREVPKLFDEAEKRQETIYTFLGRIAGVDEDTARFCVYVIPACLYDILAPFALSVVLLLLDKNRQKGERNA